MLAKSFERRIVSARHLALLPEFDSLQKRLLSDQGMNSLA